MINRIQLLTIVLFAISCSTSPKTTSIATSKTYTDSPESRASGKMLYSKNCATCHGDDGKGQGETAMYLTETVPSLAVEKFKNGNSSEEIYKVIASGLANTSMKGFLGPLTESQIWDLTFFVGSFRSK